MYLLKNKSDTQFLIPEFANMVHTQFDTKIKSIRSDHGTKFYLKQFFHSTRILNQLSCVDTPQQNAIVERKHQHILNVARALMFQSKISLSLWGDCILTTMYLINRTPSKILGNKSPYEVLFHTPPSYDHLRCFGCLYFISTLSNTRHKFAPRARKCVFLGYSHGIKGYKALDINSNTIHISRDIVFYEHIFPFAGSSPAPHSISIPCPYPNPHIPSDITDSDADLPSVAPIPTFDFADATISNAYLASPSLFPDTTSLIPFDTIPTLPVLRRSTRPHHPPAYLSDYACKAVSAKLVSGMPYDISDGFSYSHLGSSFHSFFMAVTTTPSEPATFHQAVQSPEWKVAINKEITALDFNNTWTLTPLPPGKSHIGCKWVFRIKYNSYGTIERYKARLVAKGFTQKLGMQIK